MDIILRRIYISKAQDFVRSWDIFVPHTRIHARTHVPGRKEGARGRLRESPRGHTPALTRASSYSISFLSSSRENPREKGPSHDGSFIYSLTGGMITR